ncbi:hypothetical protein [Salinarimonas sp.]|uniref:COG4223 family protein n=1 Tax=Salinarimonas sp. TaxID=2766526 RepID=UPI0032D943F5
MTASEAASPSSEPNTIIVTDEARVLPAPPAAKPAGETAEPPGETAREATPVASVPAVAARPAAERTPEPEPVSEPSPEPLATTAPSGGADELAAAAALEDRPGAPPLQERGGTTGALAAAIVAALVVAGVLVAYDLFARPGAADTTALEERLAAVESQALAARDAASEAQETASGAVEAAPDEERLASLESRIAEVAETAQAARETAGEAPAAERIASLEERVSALATRLDEEIAPTLQGLQQEIGRIDEATQAAEGARQAVEAAQGEMTSLREAVAAEAQATREAYLAITAANAIVSALPAGTPYAGALDTLQAAGVEDAILEDLAVFAETGAPTAETLRADFAAVAPDIRRALTPEDPTQDGVGSFFEGLFSRAVRVEPVDGLEAPGDPAIDPVADVVRALAVGDLEAAHAALQALPEDARAVSQAFGDRLAARIAAGEAARAAMDRAQAALAPQN